MRKVTEEQKQKSEERRKRFGNLIKSVAAMTDLQREQLAAKMLTLITVEGKPLSLRNTCLLAMQCPAATIIGGFRQWKAQGRHVRKGEHGLMIWIPCFPGKDERAEGEKDDSGSPAGFIIGTVFDISQTEADEISAPAQVEPEAVTA